MALKRLQAELVGIQEAGKFDVEPVEDNLFKWHLALKAPEGSPYEGGTFLVEISFPNNYPIKPPDLKVITKIYHPEVSTDGKVCQASQTWNPKMTIADVIIPRLVSMLTEPSAESPMNPDAGRSYLEDRAFFLERAKEWVRAHAS